MHTQRFYWLTHCVFCVGLFFLNGCAQQNALTIYTSVDQDYSEPIIENFRQQNPEMEVNVVYDSEMTKTTGLFIRLQEERNNPQADVFWNSEITRTIQLKNEKVLQPYQSPNAAEIPDQFKDPENYWTGFSGRLRVMIISETVTETPTPASVPALANPRYVGKTGMADPRFGTTASHLAALYTTSQPAALTMILTRLKNMGVKILPGNATVRDQVAAGTLAFGLTDTDDAFAALDEGKPVKIEYLDQNGSGTLLIPNTVAMIAGAPNPDNAKSFIDYLLSPEVEEQLAKSRARQIPLRDSVPRPENVPDLSQIKVMDINYSELAENLPAALEIVTKIF